MYICLCMYACMHACKRACMRACKRVCVFVHCVRTSITYISHAIRLPSVDQNLYSWQTWQQSSTFQNNLVSVLVLCTLLFTGVMKGNYFAVLLAERTCVNCHRMVPVQIAPKVSKTLTVYLICIFIYKCIYGKECPVLCPTEGFFRELMELSAKSRWTLRDICT